MPGLIYYDEIKKALGLPSKARLTTVEKALRRRNLPFEYGDKGLFSTLDAWNNKIAGVVSSEDEIDDFEFKR